MIVPKQPFNTDAVKAAKVAYKEAYGTDPTASDEIFKELYLSCGGEEVEQGASDTVGSASAGCPDSHGPSRELLKQSKYKPVDPSKAADLRREYIARVQDLKSEADAMKKAGKTEEEVARAVHGKRRALGMLYKHATPPAFLNKIYDRNEEKYGDKYGPTVDYLRGKGKSWDDISKSAATPGGGDLGLQSKL